MNSAEKGKSEEHQRPPHQEINACESHSDAQKGSKASGSKGRRGISTKVVRLGTRTYEVSNAWSG
jgi:hypothetical protein